MRIDRKTKAAVCNIYIYTYTHTHTYTYTNFDIDVLKLSIYRNISELILTKLLFLILTPLLHLRRSVMTSSSSEINVSVFNEVQSVNMQGRKQV
jgi:hypothetical protein